LAVAENACVLPTSIEKLALGLSVTLDTPWPPEFGVFLPRQAVRTRTNEIAVIEKKTVEQRRMNPPRVRRDASEMLAGKLPV
jgi:hypothetical protein